MIYSNGLPAPLVFPDAVQLTRPLLGPADQDVSPGTRLYSVPGYGSMPDGELLVTRGGHWYRLRSSADADADGSWVCRGCGDAAPTGRLLDEERRCPRPPTGQDIASALLGRAAVAA